MTFPIPPRDPRIHVFAVSDGGEAIPMQTYLTGPADDPAGLRAAMGGRVHTAFAEVFDVSDVAPMGLRAYLAQAHDIPDAVLAADAARLDGLGGVIVVLAPRAVEGLADLSPRSDLTHIGSYAPAQADMSLNDLPRSAPEAPVMARPPAPDPSGPSRTTIVWIVVVALILAALLVLT